MIVGNSGPHIVEHLKGRVESLTNALERAQERINELEKAFGSEADLAPLIMLGLSRSEARIVHILRSKDYATNDQLTFAVYADDPDQANEVDAVKNMKVFIHNARAKLSRLGVSINTIQAAGYRMSGPDKARLAKLIASGARLVVRGRPDRKYYRKAAE